MLPMLLAGWIDRCDWLLIVLYWLPIMIRLPWPVPLVSVVCFDRQQAGKKEPVGLAKTYAIVLLSRTA